ncbi:MAG: sulfotransferase [Gammaproteobacteria bacterium]|nr:sulfotransferase [Gammaproteobacteria bacterium]
MGNLAAPVFFIGAPRSGTTVLFEAFAKHEQLGWPSNYSRKFPALPQLGIILRLTNNRFINLLGQKEQYNHVLLANKLLPRPAEAYEFWNHYTGIDFSKQYLVNQSATPDCRNRLSRAVESILFWEGKTIFSAKFTGPSRIHFLKSIFPTARFVHVIRDGRAVVHSMLNSSAWSSSNFLEHPWWQGGLTDTDLRPWLNANKNPAILAAIQWKKIIEVAHHECVPCNNENYLEIKYEQFIEKPYEIINQLYTWCGLPDSEKTLDYLKKIKILPRMNDKYKNDMTKEEIKLLTNIMEPQLSKLGYV